MDIDADLKRIAETHFEDRRCPACGAILKLPTFPLPETQMHCSACNVQIFTTLIDATGHLFSEITPDKHFVFGALCLVFHAPHQNVCHSCRHVYPNNLSACPKLTVQAVKWYFEEKRTASDRKYILKFLCKHFDVLKFVAPYLREAHAPATFGELGKFLHSDILSTLST